MCKTNVVHFCGTPCIGYTYGEKTLSVWSKLPGLKRTLSAGELGILRVRKHPLISESTIEKWNKVYINCLLCSILNVQTGNHPLGFSQFSTHASQPWGWIIVKLPGCAFPVWTHNFPQNKLLMCVLFYFQAVLLEMRGCLHTLKLPFIHPCSQTRTWPLRLETGPLQVGIGPLRLETRGETFCNHWGCRYLLSC